MRICAFTLRVWSWRLWLLGVGLLVVLVGSGAARETDVLPDGVPFEAVRTVDQGDADAEELYRYRLTMERVHMWAAASRSLARLAREHPELEEIEEAEGEADETLTELAARLGKVPLARQAIESSGLKTREFLVIALVLTQAGLALAAEDAGADLQTFAAEAGINPAHVAFVREHWSELERIQAEIEAEEGEP